MATNTNYIQPTFTALIGAGTTLLVVNIAKDWAWPRFISIALDHLGPLSLHRPIAWVRERIDWHNLWRSRSSDSRDIRDLFRKPRPSLRCRSLLECWEQALAGAGCEVCPVVSGRAFEGQKELLMGYVYTFRGKDDPLASIVIVRKPPGAEEQVGLRADQEKVFYPLHQGLRGEAITIGDVRREYTSPFSQPDSYHRFARSEAGLASALRPLGEGAAAAALLPPVSGAGAPGGGAERAKSLEKFHEDFSKLFGRPNVRSLLRHTLFDMYSIEDSLLKLNTNGWLAHLCLDLGGDPDVRFDFYFADQKKRQAPALLEEADAE